MDTPDGDLQELLDRLDPTTRTLVAEADLGNQAKEFIASDLGRHLVGCLHQEILLAQGEYERVAFWRWRRIIQLQNRIWRAKFMLGWLRDLIVAGKAAEVNLATMENSDG